jgi:hypothetical protein
LFLFFVDIPGWLRSLRLHKYTPVFEKMHWKTIIQLSEEDLIQVGVSAQGARTKFLKVFAQIQQEMEENSMQAQPTEN